jgi:hypothetical protein
MTADAARTLACAALALDAAAMAGILAGAIRAAGVLGSWNHVVGPVLGGLGHLPSGSGLVVAAERLLGRAVFEAFVAVPRPGPGVPARVLLACAEAELETLALEAIAAALAEAGTACCFLGAATPREALDRAVRRIRPAVTVVWSETSATADPAQLRSLLNQHASGSLLAAGPGWATTALPAAITHPADLTDAVIAVLGALNAPAAERGRTPRCAR